MKILQPPTWKMPRGYSNGISARGRFIFVSGQIASSSEGQLVGSDFVLQVKQALSNVIAVLKEGEAKPENVVKMTWFVRDKAEYIKNSKEVGEVYRKFFDKHYPAMSLVQVSDLLEDGAKVEIEAIAIVSD